MDEEDFIKDLGWNRKCSESEDVLVDQDVRAPINSESVATASTSQAEHNISQSETVDSKDNVKLLKPVRGRPRGRPSKSTFLNLKPTRESQRVKRSTRLMNYGKMHTKSERNKWSQNDLAMLLEGLETYGPYNIKLIKTKLPHKTELDIKHQIQLWKDFAYTSSQSKMIPDKNKVSTTLNNSCANLNDWIDHFNWLASTSSTDSFALANVFALISEYGRFPNPDECNGVDFRAMYRYLHCVLNAEPYSAVNPRTAQEIACNISQMQSMSKDYNTATDLQPHLYNLTHSAKVNLKNYGRQPCRRQIVTPRTEVTMNMPHLNPLKIPPHILVKPTPSLFYSDGDTSSVKAPYRVALEDLSDD